MIIAGIITDAIFRFFFGAIRVLLGLFPDWTPLAILPMVEGVFDKMAPYAHLVGWLNQYLPVDQGLLILALGLTYWLAASIFNILSWLLSKTHIAGGSGQ